eukprot:PhF_6_TR43544/c0_g1_i1/m.66854
MTSRTLQCLCVNSTTPMLQKVFSMGALSCVFTAKHRFPQSKALMVGVTCARMYSSGFNTNLTNIFSARTRGARFKANTGVSTSVFTTGTLHCKGGLQSSPPTSDRFLFMMWVVQVCRALS